MVYRGTVKNNVVVLEPGAHLPDGMLVHIETPATKNGSSGDEIELFRIGELAVETGIPDLATNVDHYLYGHPKAKNAG
jgi:hypothetical protein